MAAAARSDRDRQREQQRVEHRLVQRDVDDEDRAGQRPGHLDEQHRELPQPDLELGLGPRRRSIQPAARLTIIQS